MITEILIPKLLRHFPDQCVRLGKPPEPCALFPAKHPEFGNIEIQDDGAELTVVVGNFTHGHFSNYDKNLSNEQKAEMIAEDFVNFLHDLFADRVVLYGSHRGGGGWYYRGSEYDLGVSVDHGQEYLWSGPLLVE